MDSKKCSKCHVVKSLTNFNNNVCSTAKFNSKGERLRRPECKECTKSSQVSRNTAFKIAGKPISPPIGTPCDVCKKPGTLRFPKLRFDHDHTTFQHRGWLCDTCNRSLGTFGDSLEGVVNLLNYLTKNDTTRRVFYRKDIGYYVRK